MSSDKKSESAPFRGQDTGEAPHWADGLKQLYDAVVEEELPDSFKDLLAQLDDGEDTAAKANGPGSDT